MAIRNLKTESELWTAIATKFSWAKQAPREVVADARHRDFLMACRDFELLRTALERSAESLDVGGATDILAFVEQILQESDEFHRDVLIALSGSFVEELCLFSKLRHVEFMLPLLGSRTREHWSSIVEAYRQIGVGPVND